MADPISVPADLPAFAPVSPLAAAPLGRFGAGEARAVLTALPDPALTLVIAPPGAALQDLLHGLDLPAPARTLGPDRALIAELPDAAARALSRRASLIAQTGARAAIALSGPGAETLLSNGIALDLHPAAFPPGRSAETLFGHIGLNLARLAPARWEILVPASYALALWEALIEAGRSVGVEARRG